jgi:hypothetical protein
LNLSVVVVSWNVKALLAGCLDSLYQQGPDDLEVLVIDNASTDGTPAMLSESYPQVRVLESQRNLGFGAANNLGIRQCRGQYVLLLNPDTVLKPGAIAALLGFLQAHPAAGAVGPKILNPDGSLQYSCSPAPTLQSEASRLLHLPGMRPDGYYPMEGWDQQQPHRTQVLLGACLLLPRQALEQVGGFDEEYFMYSEEVDLCYRLAQAGWELYWHPAAQVVHYGGQSTQQAAAEMFLHLYRSKTLFFRKHRGLLATLGYKLLLAATSLSRMVLAPLAWLERPPGRQMRLRQAGNYLRLLAALPGL